MGIQINKLEVIRFCDDPWSVMQFHRVWDGEFEYLAVSINGQYYRLRCIGKWGHCNGPFSPKWDFSAWPNYSPVKVDLIGA